MLVNYRGFSLPGGLDGPKRVAFQLDYRCSRCGSENVDIDLSSPFPRFCDGSPSTGDELSEWICADCGHQATGRTFKAGRKELDYDQDVEWNGGRHSQLLTESLVFDYKGFEKYMKMKMNNSTKFMQDMDARYRAYSGLAERRFYSIFYSQVREAPILILGYNPGGDPNTWDEDLLASKSFYENGEHEYVDCNYKIAIAMREFLMSALTLRDVAGIRLIPKSNLIFRRSIGQDSLSLSPKSAILESKPFVEEILVRVSPEFILLEGKTTLDIFERYYCEQVEQEIDGPSLFTPNGKASACIYRADRARVTCLGRSVVILGIGHPSKYAGRDEWTAVLQRSCALLRSCAFTA